MGIVLKPVSRAITCTLSLFLLGLQSGPAYNSSDSWIVCIHRTQDTEQILPKVLNGLQGIPSSLQNSVREAGYKIIIAPTMDFVKTDSFERRSDYDVGSLDNIAGQFRSADHCIYIPERYSHANGAPHLQGEDLIHVLRHEFGHAYDCYLGHASHSTTFANAFEHDSAKLTNNERKEFSYFAMQDQHTAATELFAELFSIICSPDDSSLRWFDRSLYQAFPECVNAIIGLSPDLKPHTFSHTVNSRTSGTTPSQAPRAANSYQYHPNTTALSTAYSLINQKQYTEAIKILDDAIKSDPTTATAYSYRGYAYLAIGQYAQAITDYKMVLQLDPKDQKASKYLDYAKKMMESNH
jgi:tetratricopeptide (TPR) repeat protein